LFSDPHKTHNTLCGQNAELLNIKPGGTIRNEITEVSVPSQMCPVTAARL